MATSRNDDKGYERGARGIDGKKGENYVNWGKAEGVCKVSGSDGGPSGQKSASARQSDAKGK